MSRLRERRRLARRRRLLARVDMGLGLAGALVLLLATPGLAIAGIVALALLALCGLSFAWERALVRRSTRGDRERSARVRRTRAELARLKHEHGDLA